jgi:hypothetical protein
MPGLASSQLKPSRPPVPVQPFPHDTSLSPTTLTHLSLLHWLSLEQKHPPADVQAPLAVLHWPIGQDVNPVAFELGQPPLGQPSPASMPPSTAVCFAQTLLEHAMPRGHAKLAPHPPQLDESFEKSAHPWPHLE